MTPDPESAARRALELVGGPLTLTPKLTGDGPLYWTLEFVRRVRVPGTTVDLAGSVSAYGLEKVLAALPVKLAEQDAALLKHLKAREEAPRGEARD